MPVHKIYLSIIALLVLFIGLLLYEYANMAIQVAFAHDVVEVVDHVELKAINAIEAGNKEEADQSIIYIKSYYIDEMRLWGKRYIELQEKYRASVLTNIERLYVEKFGMPTPAFPLTQALSN